MQDAATHAPTTDLDDRTDDTEEITVTDSPDLPQTMRAVRQRRYGASQVLDTIDVATRSIV